MTNYVSDSGDLGKSPCEITSLLIIVSSFLHREIKALSEDPGFVNKGYHFRICSLGCFVFKQLLDDIACSHALSRL